MKGSELYALYRAAALREEYTTPPTWWGLTYSQRRVWNHTALNVKPLGSGLTDKEIGAATSGEKP
jgi:hypothetical protein